MIRVPFFLIAAASLATVATARGGDMTAVDLDRLHAPFDRMLRKYVSERGVNYGAWDGNVTDRRALREYVASLQRVELPERPDLPEYRDAVLAYWINLYNAATLRLVLGEYPIDSIKDLGGLFSSPWDQELVTVEGERLSLNRIENEIIRPRFSEPRIHFALNCAARSCPPLRRGAYTGNRLDEQLEEQTAAFLSNPEANRIEGSHYRLSRIFDWYAEDFEEEAGSVEAWVRPYLANGALEPDKQRKVKYLDYDWDLNDSRSSRSGRDDAD